MRRLRADRDAKRKIMRRPRRRAALVAAPIEQDVLHLDPAPEQRGIVAIGREEDVLFAHGAGDADRDRLLAERNRIGAESSRALQRHRLQIEGSREHHRAVKGNEQVGIGREARQRSEHRAVRRKIGPAAHLETGNHRKPVVWRSVLVVHGRYRKIADRIDSTAKE
jgi:hypothetical protein